MRVIITGASQGIGYAIANLFAKKEAEWAKKEVARKAEIAKLQNEYEAAQKELAEFRSVKESYRKDPEGVLKKLGLTYQELTEAVIDYYDNADKAKEPPDPAKIREEVLEQLRQEQLSVIEQQRAAALDGFRQEISQFVETKGGEYPYLLNLYNQFGQSESPEQLIFDSIEAAYKEMREYVHHFINDNAIYRLGNISNSAVGYDSPIGISATFPVDAEL